MKSIRVKDISTEEKILEAARKVFTKKGYAAARTRDIADEAGINLALLNYYFKSKELLFESIMIEKLSMLFGRLMPILMNPDMEFNQRVERIVESYIELLNENQELPVFVLNELKNQPGKFLEKMPVDVILKESHFVRQLQLLKPDVHPLHFLMSILGMVIFPFVMKPVFIKIGSMDETNFKAFMRQRQELIPIWVKAMVET